MFETSCRYDAHHFLSNVIVRYCDFSIEHIPIIDAERTLDTCCSVYSVTETQYKLSSDALPLICWSSLLGLLAEGDDVISEFRSEICFGFADYLKSNSFLSLIENDCDFCFPQGVYDSCIQSLIKISDIYEDIDSDTVKSFDVLH